MTEQHGNRIATTILNRLSELGYEVRESGSYAKLEAEAQALREQYEKALDSSAAMGAALAGALEEVAALRARVVVVPERKPIPDQMTFPGGPAYFAKVFDEVVSWNACLDELARLNGKAVSEGLLRRVIDHLEWDGNPETTARDYVSRGDKLADELRALLGEGKGHD